jgi:hypothetical protein
MLIKPSYIIPLIRFLNGIFVSKFSINELMFKLEFEIVKLDLFVESFFLLYKLIYYNKI